MLDELSVLKMEFVVENLSILGDAKPRETETKTPASRRRGRPPLFHNHSRQPVGYLNKSSKNFSKEISPKIAKKIIMDKFLSSHFHSESTEYYPEDFQGIICISSDDEMECASSASVDDLESLSDDDEVALLAEGIERQIELPLASESIPVPSCSQEKIVPGPPGFHTSPDLCSMLDTLI